MRTTPMTVTASLAIALLGGASWAGDGRPQQVVDGQVLILGGELLNNPHDAVLQAHHTSRRYLNSHLTYGFDLDPATRGGTFVVDQRRAEVQGTAGGDTWAVTFLDKRIGERGARVLAYVDSHHNGSEMESGAVPAEARSAYVTATHGINQAFRYTAVAPTARGD